MFVCEGDLFAFNDKQSCAQRDVAEKESVARTSKVLV